MTTPRESANQEAFRRLTTSEPVLEDVRPAGEVVPGFARETILTSGPTMPWSAYVGGQRAAILGAAQFEGLARDAQEAERKLACGEISVRGCQELGCVGSLAGVYSASMPVFVVRNAAFGNVGYCNIYEGTNRRRLNYGVYDEGVRDRLRCINDVIAPVLGEAVRATGGIALKPIMIRALHMSDDLHSRNTAASLLFAREIVEPRGGGGAPPRARAPRP
ncbi:MAG: oxamate carbamoyltransferase subunit AllG family protein, partial [Betaproteobacteria bacterium]